MSFECSKDEPTRLPRAQTKVAPINDSAAGALVKRLVAAAEREEALMERLTQAIDCNDTERVVELARELIASRLRSPSANAKDCAAFAG